jgi:squalene-hopene/tetraprenyl-beta-curcumene cyclase
LPQDKQLHELYPVGTEDNDFTLPRDQRLLTWRNFFLRADRALKILERWHSRPLRQRALEEAERWMVERIGEGSDGLAAVFSRHAQLHYRAARLNYPKGHPLYQKALKDFASLFVDDP